MEYFVLTQSKRVIHPIKIYALDSSIYKYSMTLEQMEKLDDLRVAYFEHTNGVEMSDILVAPTFLITTPIKKVFSLYDEAMRFKGVQLFTTDEEDQTAPLYWVPLCKEIACIHRDTSKYDNGLVKTLVLDEQAIHGESIFKVKGLVESKIIITLPVAESLLRRKLYGIGLEKVEVK